MNKQIIFVDTCVKDYQKLLKGASELAKIVLLDNQYNGVEQISATLAENQNLEAVHIISHGSPGSILIGNSQLNLENLNNYSSQLQQWGKSLAEKAVILLYGCSVAAGKTGIAFQKRLSQLVGASVAANDKPTGNALLGGNWQLKSVTGAIQTPLALAEEVIAAYPWVLGIHLVKDIPGINSSSSPYNLTNVNGTLYFNVEDGTHGVELWKSDGTEAGTVLVKDIHPGSGWSAPNFLTNVNGTVYFAASDGTHGFELWKSDGTETGTVLVKDINPGNVESYPFYLININGTLYFTATDATHGRELWKSDGTAAGTVLVKDINPGGDSHPENLTNFNGSLYFTAYNGTTGGEWWKSDGTSEGTVLVKDIKDITQINSSNSLYINGIQYFQGYDDTHGYELWKSDGTSEGTVLVKDIYPGIDRIERGNFTILNHSSPHNFTIFNGTLYFTATDATHGHELWKSDGTEDGTVLVKDTHPGSEDLSEPENFFSLNGTLYFTADTPNLQRKLWKSDGTEEGTVVVQHSNQDGDFSDPSSFTHVNGTVYFRAYGTHGYGLWKLAPSVVTAVSATTADGTYGTGQTLNLTISFDEAVTINTTGGTPHLQLATGTTNHYATYLSGSGTNTLTFSYIVQAGDNSTDLQYVATNSLELNGATIKSNGLDANLTLPSLTSPLSLGGSKNLAIDPTLPAVISNSDSTPTTPPTQEGYLGDLFPTLDLGILTLIPNTIAETLQGTEGDDLVIGDATAEAFNVKGGDDLVAGLGGGDNLYGGDRSDLLFGNSGNDYIDGGAANDLIFAGQDNDAVNGGQDRDTVLGNLGNDTLLGGTGNDWLGGNQGTDIIDGEGGDDRIFGGQGNDSLLGNIGNDIVVGDIGDDLVKGSDGNDLLFGNTGADFLAGGAGEDTVFGGKDADIAKGGTGNDIIVGNIGNDTVCGSEGHDWIYGNIGADSMDGCEGDDTLYGGKDNDTLIGNKGNDVLNGEMGNDYLVGGTGSDRFILSPDGGQEIIADFEEGTDTIILAGSITFADLSIGTTNNQTLITLLTKGELLATLNGVPSNLITLEDFALI